ncbi:MAG TPA: efflux transporter outer membrane subunit [Verrucomicrobiae bacterium]
MNRSWSQKEKLRNGAILSVVALIVWMTGCAVGPDYKKPEAVTPPDWGWKLARPNDQAIQSDWWKLFQDPMLNQLETEATGENQQIQAALARIDQSRSIARITDSRFFPQLSFDPSVKRFHTEQDAVPSSLTENDYTLPLDLSYEIDIWGRIRRSFESARAQAQATVADYYNLLLVLHGDVAINYFLLRQLDAQIVLVDDTLKLQQNSVKITAERFHAGLATELDWDRARAELAQTKTLRTGMQRQRDDLQNALAVLCGQPASRFQIMPGTLNQALPVIPVGLPSALLERRPDIAEAERKMAAANAQIGVAKAAFFPAVSLTGDAGYSSFQVSSLLDWESRLFQIGPQVAMPILNGGRLKAGLNEARANYQASCAAYQQQVLVAFKDVSDSLVDLNTYGQQVTSEAETVNAADRAESLAAERYRSGMIDYLDVLDSQRTELQAQIQMTQIHTMQFVATVRLVKALGGGFDAGTTRAKPNQRNQQG